VAKNREERTTIEDTKGETVTTNRQALRKVRISNDDADSGVECDPRKPITALTSLECVEPDIQSLHDACIHWGKNLTITKIAQGSYATIFRMQMKAEPNVYTVWKLIPLKNRTGRGCRAPDQTFIEDAAAEVKVLALMAEIEGFVEYRSARVLQGSMPLLLQKLNTDWQTIHPDEETGIKYRKDQMWLLVEMSDAGTDLETLLKNGFLNGELLPKAENDAKLTIQQTWDIFWGTAEALARGEAIARFEHRDLHPGNICISIRATPLNKSDKYTVSKNTNFEVTIIDYTLSRATFENDEVLANSMKDRSIFGQSSLDRTDNRQYSMYRYMRSLVEGGANVRHGKQWHEFIPMTNILWLYHILKFLLDNTESYSQDPTGKAFTILKERQLAERLAKIVDRMDPTSLNEWLYLSAGDVVSEEVVYKTGIERGVLSLGIDDFPEDSEIMAKHRRARWTRCAMKSTAQRYIKGQRVVQKVG